MPFPKVKISDDSGNTVGVDTSSNALNVKLVESIDSIDIGDVSILAGDGTAITDTVAGRLDVTLMSEHVINQDYQASDKGVALHGVQKAAYTTFGAEDGDYAPLRIHFANPSPGALVVCGGTKEDSPHNTGDGGIMALGVRLDAPLTMAGLPGDYTPLLTNATAQLWTALATDVTAAGATVAIGHVEDRAHANSCGGIVPLAVRNDDVESLSGADNDYSVFQVNANGALYVTGESKQSENVTDYGVGIMGEAKTVDGSSLPNIVAEGEAVRLTTSRQGILYTALVNKDGLKAAIMDDDDPQVGTPAMVNVGGEYRNSDTTYTDGDATILQTNISGHLKIAGSHKDDDGFALGTDYGVMMMGFAGTQSVGADDAAALACSTAGHLLVDIVDGGQLDTIIDTLETTLTAIETDQAAIEALLITIDADTNTMQGNLINIGNAVYSDDDNWTDDSSRHMLVGGLYQSSMQTVTDGDVAPLQVDVNGVLRTSHSITGMVSDRDEDVGTTAEKIHTAADVAIKRIDIQAAPANTGYIFVGDSGVAGDGSGGGIRLAAGDFYSLDIDNTADVYVAASVDQEDVYYTYYT